MNLRKNFKEFNCLVKKIIVFYKVYDFMYIESVEIVKLEWYVGIYEVLIVWL